MSITTAEAPQYVSRKTVSAFEIKFARVAWPNGITFEFADHPDLTLLVTDDMMSGRAPVAGDFLVYDGENKSFQKRAPFTESYSLKPAR